jgi:hypothetical protein
MTTKFAKQAKTAIALNAQRCPAKSVLEATVLIEGIDTQVIKCKARETFTRGRVTVEAGREFFLVRSSKWANRYYVVVWSNERSAWQCSCHCYCSKNEHCLIVNEWIVRHVVTPKKRERVAEAAPCSVEVATPDVAGVTRPYTAEEYRQLHKRNQAWQQEQKAIDRGKVEAYAQCDVAERKIA